MSSNPRLAEILDRWRALAEMEKHRTSSTGHATLPGSIGRTYAFTMGGKPFDGDALERTLNAMTDDFAYVLPCVAELELRPNLEVFNALVARSETQKARIANIEPVVEWAREVERIASERDNPAFDHWMYYVNHALQRLRDALRALDAPEKAPFS